MGLNRGLQGLIERAWTLHDGITAEIDNTTSFCRFCSQNGDSCAIVETPFPEKERLIAIRDSLQEVRDVLMFLQVSFIPFSFPIIYSKSWLYIIFNKHIYLNFENTY